MKQKSIIALVLTAAMLLGGCGSTAGDSNTGQEPESSKEPEAVVENSGEEAEDTTADDMGSEEQMELECMVDMNNIMEGNPIIQKIEEELNVKFTFIPAPTGSADDIRKAMNLQISSGDFPDFIANVKFPDYYAYAEQGLIAEVPVDWIKSEAPNLANWVEKNLYGEASWDYYAIEGKNYIVPSIWTLGPKFNSMVVRQDILEEVGVTEMPNTLEEWEDALLKVKEAKGGYPLSAPGGIKGVYDMFFGAYGLYPQIFTEKDGKIVYGAVEPAAKQALEVAHRWYEEGLIDPEFVIDDETKKREKWTAEKMAVTVGAFYHAIPGEAYWGGAYYDPLMEKNPNAEVVTMLPPAGPDGERGMTQDTSIVNAGVVFAKELENQPEKLKKYLQVCDYMIRESELLQAGDEGVTYQRNASGDLEWIAPYDDADKRKEYGIGTSGVIPGFQDYDVEFTLKPAEFADIRTTAIDNCVGKFDVLGPVPRPIYQEKKEALDRITSKNLIDFITGDRDLSEFDAFVEEWNAAGGSEVMVEAQEYYEKLGLINVTKGAAAE
mgnify:CR=1 FL=1